MTLATGWSNYLGYYLMPYLAFEVKRAGGRLAAALPGVPDGYEMLLAPQAEDAFVLQRGQLAGMPVRFVRGDAGEVNGARVGEFELARHAAPPEPQWQEMARLPEPPLRLDEAKEAAFAALWQEIRREQDGRLIDYRLPYPKHEFLRTVSRQDEVLFHGSNNPDIDAFRPVRLSYELRDSGERGNLQAVYATHDGLWPMFFAVVDRKRLRGSINNGVTYFENGAGDTIAMYNFSVSWESLAEGPWCTGTIYLLPRLSFRRLPLAGEVMSNEWASETAVRPWARLRIEPAEFPFLADVRGHDDEELKQFGELSDVVLAAVTAVAETAVGGLSLTLSWQADLGPRVLAYVTLLRKLVPTARLALRFEPNQGAVQLLIAGPPAFMQVVRNRLEKRA